ncbi:MAG: Gfo/Idh/MocA family oxidoreductase [Caldilineaceae bacterium]
MADALRVGVLGMTHDHVWDNVRDLNDSPLGTLVAAADPNEELRNKIAQEYGCPQTFASYEALLESVVLDAVYIYGDNLTGAELAILAAEYGLHIMVEKPMASTLDGANHMLAAARRAGVSLMINWPFAWWPQLQHAFTMAANGDLGQIFQTKYRSAHAGPKELGCTPYFYNWLYDGDLNGAGALMDYCCYGAALARTFLGQPSRVTGTIGHCLKDYITLDDNAILVMQWPRALAISEASWTQIGHLTAYHAAIYGSKGTLVVEPRDNGRLLLATAEDEDGIAVDVPALPTDMRNATAYFLSRIRQGLPIEGICSAEVSRDAQEILEAGLISAQEGRAVSLPLPISY